jgi:hypothetical protein
MAIITRLSRNGMLVGPRPLHREQHRASPLAAHAHALDKADHGQDDGTPDSDLLIGGDEADRRSGKSGQKQRGYQRGLAADAIAIVAEDRGTDRPGDEAHRVDGERLQHTNQGIGLGKEELGKDEAGHRAVEQEVVPFDRGADGAGDQCAAQLRLVLGFRQRAGSDVQCRHHESPWRP